MLKKIVFIYCYCIVANATSLYSDTQYTSLVGDHRSHKVGESLTVLIFEEASSATSADTDTKRLFDISAEAKGNRETNAGELGLSNNYAGGGTINRSGKLAASVTVTIIDLLDTGEMAISGEQVIEFNNEKQHIKLSGRVRPEDISAQNTILSTRVAGASITYVGDGLLGRRQKPGIFTRFFDWLF